VIGGNSSATAKIPHLRKGLYPALRHVLLRSYTCLSMGLCLAKGPALLGGQLQTMSPQGKQSADIVASPLCAEDTGRLWKIAEPSSQNNAEVWRRNGCPSAQVLWSVVKSKPSCGFFDWRKERVAYRHPSLQQHFL
jgi:hypothetical protein